MTINGICKRCNDSYCFGGCLPFGYKVEDEKFKYISVDSIVKPCPECQNNPSYITQDDSMNGCNCRTCGGYEEPKTSVKESYIFWRSNLSRSHWKLYTNMPNTLSEDAFAAGYLAGSKRRGSK